MAIVHFLILTRLLVKNVSNNRTEKKLKSGENRENQFRKSGDFLSGEKLKSQEFQDQIRRFGNPVTDTKHNSMPGTCSSLSNIYFIVMCLT
jgi:hypothetical protein